jgi:hypothetical protein
MPLSINSTRYRRQLLERVEALHKRRLGDLDGDSKYNSVKLHDLLYDYFLDSNISAEEAAVMEDKLCQKLAKNFIEWAIPLLNGKILAIDDMEDYIHAQELSPVRAILWPILDDVWTPAYRGPVIDLGAMAEHGQSVHMKEIETTTKTGIAFLQEMNIAQGQKTLREIEEAFRLSVDDKKAVSKVIADMKNWGAKKTAMDTKKNIYRPTLRGLWAKIKTYDDETKAELIKRLYEEASESLEMCADGHVARLVNVLIGFDDNFKLQISPMEYFQENIAKISENTTAPLDFKIEQAKRLMDDIRMPEDQREAWLDAL